MSPVTSSAIQLNSIESTYYAKTKAVIEAGSEMGEILEGAEASAAGGPETAIPYSAAVLAYLTYQHYDSLAPPVYKDNWAKIFVFVLV